ncbi:sporulation protein [Dactylosporangium sp. AC04546]|uniref:sporulation protein n=1 Tax=Dactylosporangium sp. AC04546 TaxID=2862460 RepID=UPI001EDF733B|nr:sporulation protein [Dactylosporangium sp. AC04546]WVK80156.1 sporulation protein [Dactylosporangium sp. AC04546]
MLHEPCVRPGTLVPGEVHVRAGATALPPGEVTLSVETRSGVAVIRHRITVASPVPAGRARSVPFLLPLPWETPLTRPIPAVSVLLRTAAFGESAVEPIDVHPLLGHQRVLDAVRRLGFRLVDASLETGPLPGVRRSVPFHQEFTFRSGAGAELRVVTVAGPAALDVVARLGSATLTFAVRAGADPFATLRAWLPIPDRDATDDHLHPV